MWVYCNLCFLADKCTQLKVVKQIYSASSPFSVCGPRRRVRPPSWVLLHSCDFVHCIMYCIYIYQLICRSLRFETFENVAYIYFSRVQARYNDIVQYAQYSTVHSGRHGHF